MPSVCDMQGVALIAISADDLAIGAYVLAVMAAEAAVNKSGPDCWDVSSQLSFISGNVVRRKISWISAPRFEFPAVCSVQHQDTCSRKNFGRRCYAMHRRVVCGVGAGQNRYRFLFDEGKSTVETPRQQRLIDGLIGWNIDMRWTIVAVDAVHVVACSLEIWSLLRVESFA